MYILAGFNWSRNKAEGEVQKKAHMTPQLLKNWIFFLCENIKIRLKRSLAMSVFLYTLRDMGSHIWATKKSTSRWHEVLSKYPMCLMHLPCNLRQGLHQDPAYLPFTGSHEDLLITVKRSKLKWYGHVSQPSCLADENRARQHFRFSVFFSFFYILLS